MPDIQIQINPENIINPAFLPLMSNTSRWIVMKGGAGSSKSFSAAQKILIRTITEPNHRFFCIRKTFTSIRVSQFSLLRDIINNWGLSDFFQIYQKDLRFIYKPNGNEIISMGLDDPEKIKSIAQPTGFWFEEPTELELRDFLQVDLRLRGLSPHYYQSILSFNPISELHWLKEHFFPPDVEMQLKKGNTANLLKEYDIDGEKIKLNAHIHHSTFRDNLFLDGEYKAFLMSLYETDPHYASIYVDGNWGSIGNLVYPNGYIMIDKKDYPKEFDEVIYGLDFGSSNPTALIKLGIYDQEVYLDELIYEPLNKRLKTLNGLIEEMKGLNISEYDTIYADSANPTYIEELINAGFSVKGAKKGEGSVKAGIDRVKRRKIHSHSGNININKEVVSYKYKEDDKGNALEEILKMNDHGQDGIRYAISGRDDDMGELHIWLV